MMSIKVLVIENKRSTRSVITSALKAIENVKVVGHSSSCLGAFKLIDCCSPDIVFLDYEMPQISIETTIGQIKKINPNTEVILVSKMRRTSATSSLRALKLGALYFIKKPTDNSSAENIQYFSKYLQPIIKLFIVNQKVELVRRTAEEMGPSRRIIIPPSRTTRPTLSGYEILAIGCSLGGPEALKKIIPKLPAEFPIPILVTQHMPEGFTSILASELDFRSKLIVMEGRSGITLQPGYVYIAPGGKHMQIREVSRGLSKQRIIVLDEGPLVHNCRPAVDVMFNSLAKNLSSNILAVILTGMGHDGLAGIQSLKRRGNCFCLTQDQNSSVVYGMPGAVALAGLSDLSLPLGSIADQLKNMVCDSVQTVGSI
jgi:two-component system chemotaxis response regulator CheB